MVVTHTLGQVNLSGYLRVSLEKVSAPGVEVDVLYIALPFVTYNYITPDIDADNYYIFFREAPDVLSLGTLRSQAFFNAQSQSVNFERRFYPMNALPAGATHTITKLHDDYLIGKSVTGVEKEGFRHLKPADEYVFSQAAGDIDLVTATLNGDETLVVELTFNIGSVPTVTSGPLFTATITVAGSAYTMSATDRNKRFCLDCSGTKQVFSLCALAGLTTGDRVILEHKRDGIQLQTRILPDGSDKIRFNGLNVSPIDLTEIWLSMGHSLYLRKEGSFWEIIFDWNGTRVGERMSGTFAAHPLWLPEDARLLDGDEIPGLYWWVKNVLPSTHKIVDDTVVGAYAHPAGKEGLFVIHSSLKKFRLPNTQGFYEKGLKSFTAYNTDTDRSYDYPGGTMQGRNKEHGHGISSSNGAPSSNLGATVVRATLDGTVNTKGSEWAFGNPDTQTIRKSGGATSEVNNSGVIFLRNIG